MAIRLDADLVVRRDGKGIIRQLQHVGRPYRPAGAMMAFGGPALTPRALAEAYLRDAADLFAMAPSQLANFSAGLTQSPTAAPVELRFKEEKQTAGAVTVSYDQTVLGLPIWDAGASVRIDASQLHVTGSHNATHYEVHVDPPPANAPYLPHRITTEALAGCLGIPEQAESLTISSTRSLVYRYDPAERFDPQVRAHQAADPAVGLAGPASPAVPTLPAPEPGAAVQPDRHYVVTEVLFARSEEQWGPLNWRCFLEQQSGSVLYLRALVACARGSVFSTDPVSRSGQLHGASAPLATLDGLRDTVTLFGLGGVNGNGRQALEGEYVRLVNISPPAQTMPSEQHPFDFLYSATSRDFAACSAYHHCDGFFRMLQGMGIDVASYFNNTDFPVPVDPHALNNGVNAQAPGNTFGNGLGRLVFGTAASGSTMGIAADVRVVIHEFGHAVLWDHVNSPNFGWAHSPGDSLAVILHDPDSQAPDRFETFPFMNASAGLSRRHDRDVAAGWAWGGTQDDTQYGSEQILSTTLFRVYRATGGDSPDPRERRQAARHVAFLILKAVGLLSFTTKDPDVFVAALVEADATTPVFDGFPGGAFSKIFRWSFEQQGLYQRADHLGSVTTAGEPPEVDVFIDDGRFGAYLPFQANPYRAPDIWNRRAADGQAMHQPPAVGQPNFAYVRIKNRGRQPAATPQVRGFRDAGSVNARWPNDWKPLATPSLVAGNDLPAGGSMVVGPFVWTPSSAGEALLFEVSAAGDRSVLDGLHPGPVMADYLLALDNNLAARRT